MTLQAGAASRTSLMSAGVRLHADATASSSCCTLSASTDSGCGVGMRPDLTVTRGILARWKRQLEAQCMLSRRQGQSGDVKRLFRMQWARSKVAVTHREWSKFSAANLKLRTAQHGITGCIETAIAFPCAHSMSLRARMQSSVLAVSASACFRAGDCHEDQWTSFL